MNQPKVAVTGGSGHLGINLVTQLIERGYDVNALYLTSHPPVYHKKLRWMQGSILDQNIIEKVLNGADIVIHAAGLVSLSKLTRNEILETNVLGTQNIVDYCTLLNREIRMIHISSTGAVEVQRHGEKFDENRPYITSTQMAYSWSKSLSEQLVIEAIKNKGLDAVILRPSAVIGPNDYKLSIMGNAIVKFLRRQVPAITTGGYNFVDVRDATRTIINSIEKGRSGEVYNVGGKYYSMAQLGDIISEISGVRAPSIVLPIGILALFEPLITWWSNRRGYTPPFNKDNIYYIRHGIKNLDSSKAIKELGHQIRPVEDSLRDIIAWFKENDFV